MIPIRGNIHLSFTVKMVIKARKKRVNTMDETKAKSIFWVRLADGKTKRLSTIPSLAASVVPTVLGAAN
ncbi:Uncharacterised protein [Streptococcus pneumoniae]|nr:Uncharacterised protein [Streptococcus pneumoniae]